jgi:RsiW-degrading membrane proteinase PrsW (M82 family)
MRRFLLIFFLLPILAHANSKIYTADQTNIKPTYPGGDDAFYDFINDFTDDEAYYATPKGEYPPITVSFIIDSTGIVHNIKCINNLGCFYEGKVLDALNHMPKWNPGKVNGVNVNVSSAVVIKYTLPGTKIYENEYRPRKTNTHNKSQSAHDFYNRDEPTNIKSQNNEQENISKTNLFVLLAGFVSLLLSFSLAILPGVLIIMLVFYWRRKRPEPFKVIAAYFMMGVFSIIPAIIIENLFNMENYLRMGTIAAYSILVVGLTEESWKFIFLRVFAYRKKNLREPYDGILYSVIISMGFATTENILYTFGGGSSTALIRMFTAVPAHASFAVLMGFFLGVGKFKKLPILWMVIGLVIAVLCHGIYDFFLLQKDFPSLKLATFLFLIISIIFSVRAIMIGRRYHVPVHTQQATEDEYTKDGM